MTPRGTGDSTDAAQPAAYPGETWEAVHTTEHPFIKIVLEMPTAGPTKWSAP